MSETLNSTIGDENKKLKKLKENINMFPTDFAGFVDQGGKNSQLYVKFAIIPVLVILTLTVILFVGGVDLSAKYAKMPTMDLYTMLGSRLPFTAISLGIVFACYKLTKFLVAEIMRINRQRLNLQKVSILANDISTNSLIGLDLNSTEVYELKTKLKMDMIKSHLKTYLDEDYEYQIELSILERFGNWIKKPKFKANLDAKTQTASVELTATED